MTFWIDSCVCLALAPNSTTQNLTPLLAVSFQVTPICSSNCTESIGNTVGCPRAFSTAAAISVAPR